MKTILALIAILGVVVIFGYSNRITQKTVDDTQEVLGGPMKPEGTVLSSVTYKGQAFDVISVEECE